MVIGPQYSPRGVRSESRRRRIVIRIRVDSPEYTAILNSAKSVNLSLSAYVRNAALRKRDERKVTDVEAMIVVEIASIVSRVERVSRAEGGGTVQDALAVALADLRALSDRIVRRIL